jgi:hypothetical protein
MMTLKKKKRSPQMLKKKLFLPKRLKRLLLKKRMLSMIGRMLISMT